MNKYNIIIISFVVVWLCKSMERFLRFHTVPMQIAQSSLERFLTVSKLAQNCQNCRNYLERFRTVPEISGFWNGRQLETVWNG